MSSRKFFALSISLAGCLIMFAFQPSPFVINPEHPSSMTQKISPVIKPEELKTLKDQYVLIDARAGAPGIKEKYLESHLKGALFVDLDKQLADIKPNAANGGRHPLPTPQRFAEVLMQLGIGPASHVVVYDDKNGANAAARFWWMMRAIGHEKIQVLDGGLQAAIAAGLPTSSGEEKPGKAEAYRAKAWKLLMADMNEVEKVAQDKHYLVIDVRDAYRYRGEKEPIDLVAGHIPGAVNIPFSTNLDEKGFYLSPSELKAKYTQALDGRNPDEVIVHCGSGVTACHTLLAMDYAGMEIPKLYVGSWSEWSRNDKPIGKGE